MAEMLKNELYVNFIEKERDTPLSDLFYLWFVWAETGKNTIADDTQVVLDDKFEGIKNFHDGRDTIGADFEIGFNDLLADGIKKMSGRPELNKLMRIVESNLLYSINSLYPFLPIWAAASFKNGRDLWKLGGKLWYFSWFSFSWWSLYSLSPLSLLYSFLTKSHAFGLQSLM